MEELFGKENGWNMEEIIYAGGVGTWKRELTVVRDGIGNDRLGFNWDGREVDRRECFPAGRIEKSDENGRDRTGYRRYYITKKPTRMERIHH
jgi:hypothetical protein